MVASSKQEDRKKWVRAHIEWCDIDENVKKNVGKEGKAEAVFKACLYSYLS